jgi:spore maturation protein SpmA
MNFAPGIFIYSQRRSFSILGTALTGVFDNISLGLSVIVALAMIVLVWLTMRNVADRSNIVNCYIPT